MRALPLVLVLGAILVASGCSSATPGWTYAPAPSVTPAPSVSAEPTNGGEPTEAPSGTAIEITALNIAFDTSTLTAPADESFQIEFANDDAGVPHNVAIHEGSPTGSEIWKGEIFNGVETRTYDVPALTAGAYGFICTVHPNMAGTLTAE
ncbi:hypothetical protein BH20CHL7_BH20CHL7_04970 [soil metagenome]